MLLNLPRCRYTTRSEPGHLNDPDINVNRVSNTFEISQSKNGYKLQASLLKSKNSVNFVPVPSQRYYKRILHQYLYLHT